ncbi:ABC transporter permease [Anaerosacchariphilus polymeriproducens]|uniref:ABC transporter permease n=1 Tax=Anaerosacchariphilus polymeriproducens TaxID=1812858 RepID=A0A371AVR9_9FIRM|nr:ABC transporter permease [Anaerosacchariphilus polymeriproducens]RDU23629.1 ABC transporter permease [Anaerosacchariphilus polymeriproducens]
MNWQIIKKDLKRNKLINLALFLFMVFSAMLAALSVIVAVQTFTSISELYKKAKPSHFMQMHKGEINREAINKFMSEHGDITYWQTCTMIDMYGECITVKGDQNTYNLSDCRLDIGLVMQNKERDILLNSKHNKAVIRQGEIGVPVLLKEMYKMELGDRIILNCNGITKEFVIKEFILDSMMNSTMCSSTRILLSEKDFNMLQGKVGEVEYLIEAYLTNSKEANAFQTDYENAGLPQNGQAVTYSMIFLLSALTDIITVFVLFFVSILLILISFICVRFTILAAMEEDMNEIGVMKAIGLRFFDIRDLYLIKYRTLAIAGVIAGNIFALLISSIFTRHISITFGDKKISIHAIVLSLIISCIVFYITNFYCKIVLKKIKKLSVVETLVRGNRLNKNAAGFKKIIYKSKKLPVNWLLGICEVFFQFRNWLIVFFSSIIVVLMILIPVNLMNTLKSPKFISYMGSSLEDIMIETGNGKNIEDNYETIKQLLKRDEDILNYQEYRRVCAKTVDAQKKLMNLHIDSGENAGNELQFLSGKSPERENELAISYLNANEMGKETNDIIVLYLNGKEKEFVISGIYQDVTSGGYTAKSKYHFSGLNSEKYSFSVNFNEKTDVKKKADEWNEILGYGIKVEPMEEFINQTLGGVVNQLRTIIFVIIIISSCLTMFVTILFIKLRLAKDLSEIAVLRAIGFSKRDIKMQYMIKIGCISMIGILTGIVLTQVLGEKISNVALSSAGLGIKKVELIINPVTEFIICPLFLIMLILLITWIVVRTIKKYNIITLINE